MTLLYIFQPNLSGKLKIEYIVYLCIYINMSSICQKTKTDHLNFGQQLLRSALIMTSRPGCQTKQRARCIQQ